MNGRNERFITMNGIVTDTKTGLQWEADYHHFNWQAGMDYARDLRLGGYSDWRMPTIEELISLIDFSMADPASTFPGMNRNHYFWSSSSCVGHPANAWRVSFYFGSVDNANKAFQYYVRCVRGGDHAVSENDHKG